ncbi:MAG: Rqc2 family fibronectin-binding protein [Lachnospiraceae bacterium]
MAFDGSVVAALSDEFNKKLIGGRISKIIQPESNELMLTIESTQGRLRLLINVNPSLPLIYLTEKNKTAPLAAPVFCMLLRKHIGSGRIVGITCPSMERIIDFEIEHYNEIGDLCRKFLTVELMGKHSNIILRDGTKIVDSIRRVSSMVSSVREVLPGREYFIPFSDNKLDPFLACREVFIKKICTGSLPLFKSLYTHVTGLGPVLSEEIAYNACLDGSRPAGSLTDGEKERLWISFDSTIALIKNGSFSPVVYYRNNEPFEYSAFYLNIYKECDTRREESISLLLEGFYLDRQAQVSIRLKTANLRQIARTQLGRCRKKYDLQQKQLKDTEKKDEYKVYGELLIAYGHTVEPKAASFTAINYYNNEEITIPLDPALSAIDNGNKYFEKYGKLKRTFESISEIIKDTRAEIQHLESILASLDTARDEADISEIRREMSEAGYIKTKSDKTKTGKGGKGSATVKSAPLRYVSSDGFDMYVGKNNYQNEYITFKLADGDDWWFHAKNRPGSHVIVKTGGRDVPESTFEEAASLAAYYSRSEGEEKVEVDYTLRKHIKKVGGGKPGFVIYHTNYSMNAGRDIGSIREIK